MSDYLDFARTLALDAGEVMKEYFQGDTKTKLKSDQSPVTIADLKINQMVIDRVAKQYPEHSVLGEEQSNILGSDYVWVCDPIDGTQFFSFGVALGTFMLTLVVRGEPQVTVVYEPISNKLYDAEKGKGARLNGRTITVSDQDLAPRVWLDICDVKDHPVVELHHAVSELYHRGVKVGGVRVSGLICGLVAEGNLVAGITPSIHPHDVAAAKLLVEEAGGTVTDVFGSGQRYDGPVKGAIFSNGVVHRELVNIIAQST